MQVNFSASMMHTQFRSNQRCNPNLNETQKSKNVSFEGYGIKLCRNARGSIYAKADILGKDYCFKMDEVRDIDSLEKMIDNIMKTKTGRFVRVKSHEYFVPYILNREPNVITQRYILENGNNIAEYDKEAEDALKILKEYLKKEIDIKDLKTVPYLRKDVPGYANNTVCNVYSYIDSVKDEIFMYIPQRNKIQIAANNGYIYRIRA